MNLDGALIGSACPFAQEELPLEIIFEAIHKADDSRQAQSRVTKTMGSNALMQISVLFVGDSGYDIAPILRVLQRDGIHADWKTVHRREALREALASFDPDVVIANFSTQGFGGPEALTIAREVRPQIPFIYVAGGVGEERAIEALKAGATDYVLKNNLARLAPVIHRALRETQERVAHETARRRQVTQYAVAQILADAQTFKEALPQLFRTICEHENFVVGGLWDVSQDSMILNCVDIWTQEIPPLIEFAARMRERQISSRGPMGLARTGREPVWIPDLQEEHKFPQAPLAYQAGLRLVVTFPIMMRGVVTGVMGLFGFDVRASEPALLDMFGAIGSQIGQFMERQTQQEQITRLNRVHAILSGIGSTIIRVRDRQALFIEACRIAVEDCGFGIAWIGTFDPQTLDVTPVAWAGFDADQIMHFSARSTARSDVPSGQGVLGRAIREKRLVFDNDITANLGVGGARRAEAVKRGYRSLIVLPLIVEDVVAGIFSLFAREPGFFTDDEVRLLTKLAGDISFALEYIGKQERLEYLANYDSLTGIANRNLLHELLVQAMAHAHRTGHMAAIAVLKLDNFRLVNDSLGLQVGDALLKVFVSRVKASIRQSDCLARLGGNEFALVLPLKVEAMEVSHVMNRISNTLFNDAQVLEMLQKILNDASQPVALEARELNLTCSMGVSLFPQDGGDVDTLIKNASAAASRARQLGGRSFQFYTAELNAHLEEKLSLHASMRRATERKEFTLHYQPKVDLQTNQIAGVEALLRWNCPSGIVQPDSFITALEETGLIVDVGRWAMEQAVVDYQQWRTKNPQPPRIAVNVSQLQLARKEFPEVVEKILKSDELGSMGLDIEITESLIMQDLAANIPKLRAIREMGVNIAIDDFGTGYSSLSYLTKLPVTTLKIDRAFIRDMEKSADGLAVVTTIISLAHSLGLKVVAEGVETEAQRNTLQLLQCDEIQGYLISYPMPAEKFEAWWCARDGY